MERIRLAGNTIKGFFVAVSFMQAVFIYLFATGQVMLPNNNNCSVYHLEPIVEVQ